jgi:hypothetical protein
MRGKKMITRRGKKGGAWFGKLFQKKSSQPILENNPTNPVTRKNVNMKKEMNDAKEYFFHTMGNNINYNLIQNKNSTLKNQLVNSHLREYFTMYEKNLSNDQKKSIKNYVKNSLRKNNTRSRSSSLASDPGPVMNNNNNNIKNENIEITNLPRSTVLSGPLKFERGFIGKTNLKSPVQIQKIKGFQPNIAYVTKTRKNYR